MRVINPFLMLIWVLEQHLRKVFYSCEDQNKVLIFSALGLKPKVKFSEAEK
jgi:hypothetical protein